MEEVKIILCDRCIAAIRSRGETVYKGAEIDEYNEFTACEWCDETETELFECKF